MQRKAQMLNSQAQDEKTEQLTKNKRKTAKEPSSKKKKGEQQ